LRCRLNLPHKKIDYFFKKEPDFFKKVFEKKDFYSVMLMASYQEIKQKKRMMVACWCQKSARAGDEEKCQDEASTYGYHGGIEGRNYDEIVGECICM
jgi:hypothetical protein